jgi:hypothetical protein
MIVERNVSTVGHSKLDQADIDLICSTFTSVRITLDPRGVPAGEPMESFTQPSLVLQLP